VIIFIRKIPTDTRYADILSFVEPAIKGGLFRRTGHIVKLEIIGFRDVRFHSVEFHALVTVEPDSAGFRALKSLKGKRLNNKMVTVRQYFERSWQNDPRQNYDPLPPGIEEKRKADRRRGKYLEKLTDITGYFSNAGDFVRKGS